VARAAGSITEPAALTALTAERALVTELGATCDTPIGAFAQPSAGGLRLTAFLGHPDGSHWIRDSVEGDAADPAALGRSVATRLASAGANALIDVR
jgi:hydroxymethylbilane synthase